MPATRSAAAPSSPTLVAPAAAPVTPRGPFQIVVATDGSAEARAAARFVRDLPLPVGSAVRVVSVIPGPEFQYADWVLATQKRLAEQLAEAAGADVRQDGVEVTTLTPCGAVPAEIIAAARDFDADLIVTGSRGRTGLPGFLLGSVARNVAHHARRPVLVVREPRGPVRKVVLAVDGSSHAAEALRFLLRLPLPAEVEIVVCTVVRPEPLVLVDPAEITPEYAELMSAALQAMEEGADRTAEAAGRTLHDAGLRSRTVVRQGDPGDQIIRLAREQRADLVIAGARGASLLKGMGIGSVADRLLKGAPCSVLLVHQPE